jgi:hypothetical protein
MSIFGYLDLAHYRPIAIQELLSWQFFFGNLPLMVLIALFLAGIFHLLQPRTFKKDEKNQPINLAPNHNKWVLGMAIFLLLIIIFEIGLSLIGEPEIGVGTPIFIGPYYRNIPTLIWEGFYTVTNFPYWAQIGLSTLPILFGWGYLAYLHGIKSYRNRSLVSNQFSSNACVWILISVALAGILFFTVRQPFSVQSTFTGFSLFILIFLLLIGINSAGWVLIILRVLIPKHSELLELPKPNRGKTLFYVFLTIGFITGCFILFVLPYLSQLQIGMSVNFPGFFILQILGVCMVLYLFYVWYRREKKDPFLVRIFLAFFGGFFAIVAIMVFFALKNESGDIEIAWIYNGIIPSIFTISLTIFFYLMGFWFRNRIEQLFARIQMKNPSPHKNLISKILFNPKILRKITIICSLFLLFAIPTGLGYRLLEDNQYIAVNSVGMMPDQEKSFFLISKYNHEMNGTFTIYSELSGTPVHQGHLIRQGLLWGGYHWKGDFSNLTAEGQYYIRTSLSRRNAISSVFSISSHYLDDVFTTGGYWYYYTRCGTAVEALTPHYLGHGPCHLTDAWYRYKNPNGTIEYRHDLNLTGGWHDSGDYNVYGGVRVPRLSYALGYAYRQVPQFYHEPERKTTYPAPANDAIPDIIEEAYFGMQFWVRRWYEPEQLFFDSSNLGEDGHIRWAVFGPPEFEDDFGYGRWIDDDDNGRKDYEGQFVNSTFGQLIVASFAEFITICRTEGYYLQNLSVLEDLTYKAYNSYTRFQHNHWHSLVMETAMFELTGNSTYLGKAINITHAILNQTGSLSGFPSFLTLGFVLDFVQRYDGVMNGAGSAAIVGNKTIENLWTILNSRTANIHNFYGILLHPIDNSLAHYHNGEFFAAIFAAAYAWNFTSDLELRKNFYNFMLTHYDWLLGRNLESVCMLEGVPGGENFIYRYQTRYRYIPGNLRGEGLGFIVDGFNLPGVNDPDVFTQSYAIRPSTKIYREVWSDVTDQFMLACGAFFRQVLSRS